jgi:hypothetical protein
LVDGRTANTEQRRDLDGAHGRILLVSGLSGRSPDPWQVHRVTLPEGPLLTCLSRVTVVLSSPLGAGDRPLSPETSKILPWAPSRSRRCSVFATQRRRRHHRRNPSRQQRQPPAPRRAANAAPRHSCRSALA